MPPPATAVVVPAYERTLRAIVQQVQQPSKAAAPTNTHRASARRTVEGKDFLQRLREAGL